MFDLKDFRAVAVSVSDLERSLAFYRDLLGFSVVGQSADAGGVTTTLLDVGGGHLLQLLTTGAPARASGWLPDDLQTGLRHIGFKCRDVDGTTARLKAAGVPFTLDPLDATGGVRIAFFMDPDGTLLEIIQGALEYHADGPAVNALPHAVPDGDTLLFDHVAISISSLDEALAFYRDRLGFPIIGQLFLKDARGFTITYIKAGSAVLELFSFDVPMQANPWSADPAILGLKYPVFEVDDTAAAAAELKAAGTIFVADSVTAFKGPDGTVFALAAAVTSPER